MVMLGNRVIMAQAESVWAKSEAGIETRFIGMNQYLNIKLRPY